eukprot:3144482-Pyramimonas_sp.AAC.1
MGMNSSTVHVHKLKWLSVGIPTEIYILFARTLQKWFVFSRNGSQYSRKCFLLDVFEIDRSLWVAMVKHTLPSQIAADTLKAILKEKLSKRDVDEGTKRGLFTSILLVERFLKYAKGTDAELAVLKEQVQNLIKTNGKGTAKAQVPSRPHTTRPSAKSVEPCSTEGSKESAKPADRRAQRVAQIADVGQLSYTLPPLVVERKARTKMGDFALMRKGLDEVSKRQIQEEHNTRKRNQRQ